MASARTDRELLRGFLDRHSEMDFELLVTRYLPMVYGTALRLAGDDHAAKDIAQAVFIVLARKSWGLATRTSLSAWLYKSTILEARAWRRSETRRHSREQAAIDMKATAQEPDSTLMALGEELDEGLMGLGGKSREALILRYFDNKRHEEIGRELGVGADAARKRVEKGLRELMRFFQRRGYRVSAAAVTASLLMGRANAVPQGLASGISRVAVAALGTTTILLRLLFLLRVAILPKLLGTSTVCLSIVTPPLLGHGWWALRQETARHAMLRQEMVQSEKRLADEERELAAIQMTLSNSLVIATGLHSAVSNASLYAWNPASEYVRLPKRIASRVTFAPMDGDTVDPSFSWYDGKYSRLQRPFFAPDGSPPQVFLSALGLTMQEGVAVTELCQNTFALYWVLDSQQSHFTNQNLCPDWEAAKAPREMYTLVTPRLREGNELMGYFKGELRRLIGPERAALFLQHAAEELKDKTLNLGTRDRWVSLVLTGENEVHLVYVRECTTIYMRGIWCNLPLQLQGRFEEWKARGEKLKFAHKRRIAYD